MIGYISRQCELKYEFRNSSTVCRSGKLNEGGGLLKSRFCVPNRRKPSRETLSPTFEDIHSRPLVELIGMPLKYQCCPRHVQSGYGSAGADTAVFCWIHGEIQTEVSSE